MTGTTITEDERKQQQASTSSPLTRLLRSHRARSYYYPLTTTTTTIKELESNHHKKKKRPRVVTVVDNTEEKSNDKEDMSWKQLLFEIRSTTPDDKPGVGIFAIRSISCGDVLVSERPMIAAAPQHTEGTTFKLLHCQSCWSPLGRIRDHLNLEVSSSSSKKKKNNPCQTNNNEKEKDEEWIPVFGEEPGPDFSPAGTSCNQCRNAHYCSIECLHRDAPFHKWICCCGDGGGEEEEKARIQLQCFHHHCQNHGIQFELAAQAILQILGTLTIHQETITTPIKEVPGYAWWKEYNHTVWWELGDHHNAQERDDRKQLCQESATLLSKYLKLQAKAIVSSSQPKKGDDAATSSNALFCLEEVIDDLCFLEQYGSIVGMLQSNAMQIDIPLPKAQYLAHLMNMLDDARLLGPKQGGPSDEEMQCRNWLEAYYNDNRSKIPQQHPSSESTEDKDDSQLEHSVSASMIGSGLFPILTLANHSCDPNVSIEFLDQESNIGSMVALRDIQKGEELCITYVANGDFDCGDDEGRRFRNFGTTRLWKVLNDDGEHHDDQEGQGEEEDHDELLVLDEEKDTGEENSSDEYSDTNNVATENDHSETNRTSDNTKEEEEDQPAEGSNWQDRQRALQEYGFICKCRRCIHEQTHDNVDRPYER